MTVDQRQRRGTAEHVQPRRVLVPGVGVNGVHHFLFHVIGYQQRLDRGHCRVVQPLGERHDVRVVEPKRRHVRRAVRRGQRRAQRHRRQHGAQAHGRGAESA